ncbi:MAG: hypothetical protein K2M06_01765 [Muribaculaceae bacterium]|nr:hypothetical protein [Muribaculaceae bacterium]
MKKILTIVSLAAAALAPFAAQAETLTLCDGTNTSDGAPVYANWLDRANRSQIIYPASMLEDLKGKSLTEFKFFISTINKEWSNNEIQISLGEVEQSSFAATEYISAPLSQVYSAPVLVATTDTEWTISFAVPYTYNGGNLLIDIANPARGTSTRINWFGVNQPETTAVCKGNNLRAINFLPKLEIEFTSEAVGAKASVSTKALSFPLTFTDDSAEQSLTIFNVGSEPVSGTIAVEGSDAFVPSLASVEIPVGESKVVDITYAPKDSGEAAATLSIELGDAGSFEVALSGKSLEVPADFRQLFDGSGYNDALPSGWTPWAVELFASDGSLSDATSDYDFFPTYYRFSDFSFDDCTALAWNHVNPAPNTDLYQQYFYIISPALKGKMMIRAMFTDLPATGAFVQVYPVESYDDVNRRFTLSSTPLEINWETPLSNTAWSIGTANIPAEARLAFFMKYSALDFVAADFSTSGIDAPAIAPAETDSDAPVMVFDLAGRPVSHEAFKAGKVPAGIYILRSGEKAWKAVK